MISVTLVITQAAPQAAAQAAPQAAPAVPGVPSPEQIREQVRASLEAARAAQADARAQGGNRRVTVGPEGIIVTPNEPGQPTVLIGPRAAQNMIPPQAVDISIAFFITCAVIVVGWPISRALGRRYEKRGSAPLLDASVADQLQRIEQAVEAVAIEVERISEGQRFLTRIQEKSPSTVE